MVGNCLAGNSCIFSHDPALLINRMNLGDGSGALGNAPSQIHPSFQVQDYDAFPALQPTARHQWTRPSSSSNKSNAYNYCSSQGSNGYMAAPRRPFAPRTTSMNGLSSTNPHGSRPSSRHQSREPTPSIPAVDDAEAFPTLGSIGGKVVKKHHGKRGGHGHGPGSKEILPNSLADIVRAAPSPALGLPRKGLTKSKSYTGSRENTLAANAIPAPHHVPWLVTGEKANQAYLKARQNAFKHGGLRNKFLQR